MKPFLQERSGLSGPHPMLLVELRTTTGSLLYYAEVCCRLELMDGFADFIQERRGSSAVGRSFDITVEDQKYWRRSSKGQPFLYCRRLGVSLSSWMATQRSSTRLSPTAAQNVRVIGLTFECGYPVPRNVPAAVDDRYKQDGFGHQICRPHVCTCAHLPHPRALLSIPISATWYLDSATISVLKISVLE